MLEVNRITKIFGKGDRSVVANKDISLSIPKGSIVGFLGANGAGKTTLVKIICNLITPTGGNVILHGKDVHKTPHIAHEKIGVMLEGARNLYNFLSLDENMQYFSLLNKLDTDNFLKNKKYLLDVFDLSDKSKTVVNELSRGMQQKAALIIALLKEPDLLILDEPTLGLDITSQITMKEVLKNSISKKENTLIICTHDLSVVNEVCEKVCIFNKGELKVYDSINSLKNESAYNNYSVVVKKSEKIMTYVSSQNIQNKEEGESYIEMNISNLEDLLSITAPNEIIKIEKNINNIEKLLTELAGD
ncbi:MAG: ABC transporter ATP-binding protein [Defluviitaleaceae bacterium]|nr:ABC transporter ATP-binding protein [Defluviitaleaceae bacterium]